MRQATSQAKVRKPSKEPAQQTCSSGLIGRIEPGSPSKQDARGPPNDLFPNPREQIQGPELPVQGCEDRPLRPQSLNAPSDCLLLTFSVATYLCMEASCRIAGAALDHHDDSIHAKSRMRTLSLLIRFQPMSIRACGLVGLGITVLGSSPRGGGLQCLGCRARGF